MQARGYAEKEGKGLKPTALGRLVVAYLLAHFPKYMDYDYTSDMESQLDEVAGKKTLLLACLAMIGSGSSILLEDR